MSAIIDIMLESFRRNKEFVLTDSTKMKTVQKVDKRKKALQKRRDTY